MEKKLIALPSLKFNEYSFVAYNANISKKREDVLKQQKNLAKFDCYHLSHKTLYLKRFLSEVAFIFWCLLNESSDEDIVNWIRKLLLINTEIV